MVYSFDGSFIAITHHKKTQNQKHHKYTKHMYNCGIAMELPFVPASPLLPFLVAANDRW
jgi:hypothetical protein